MIPLLIEPTYGGTHWAEGYLAGVRDEARRRGIHADILDAGLFRRIVDDAVEKEIRRCGRG